MEPGYDVDTEGEGDILRVTRKPQNGHRTVTMDDDDDRSGCSTASVTAESMDSYPLSYTVEQYGYHPKQVALSFDDGPDPTWTPKILDILKQYNVRGHVFHDRRGGREQRRPDAAGVSRRPRDRQPHVYASGHQRNLERAAWIWS